MHPASTRSRSLVIGLSQSVQPSTWYSQAATNSRQTVCSLHERKHICRKFAHCLVMSQSLNGVLSKPSAHCLVMPRSLNGVPSEPFVCFHIWRPLNVESLDSWVSAKKLQRLYTKLEVESLYRNDSPHTGIHLRCLASSRTKRHLKLKKKVQPREVWYVINN